MELKGIKTKIKQTFCGHRETELMTQKGPFFCNKRRAGL